MLSFKQRLLQEEIKTLRKAVINAHVELGKKLIDCEKLGHSYIKYYHSCKCEICNESFGWWCETSPNKTCGYEKSGNFDICDYCGQQEERK